MKLDIAHKSTKCRWYVLLFSSLILGCNSAERFEYVEGVVRLDGVPIEGATVSFSPKIAGNGSVSVGTTDKQGTFKLTPMVGGYTGVGTRTGDYLVSVAKSAEIDLSSLSMDTDAPMARQDKTKEIRVVVPLAYSDPNNSGLTATIKAGRNKVEFDLTKDFGSKKN